MLLFRYIKGTSIGWWSIVWCCWVSKRTVFSAIRRWHKTCPLGRWKLKLWELPNFNRGQCPAQIDDHDFFSDIFSRNDLMIWFHPFFYSFQLLILYITMCNINLNWKFWQLNINQCVTWFVSAVERFSKKSESDILIKWLDPAYGNRSLLIQLAWVFIKFEGQ